MGEGEEDVDASAELRISFAEGGDSEVGGEDVLRAPGTKRSALSSSRVTENRDPSEAFTRRYLVGVKSRDCEASSPERKPEGDSRVSEGAGGGSIVGSVDCLQRPCHSDKKKNLLLKVFRFDARICFLKYTFGLKKCLFMLYFE